MSTRYVWSRYTTEFTAMASKAATTAASFSGAYYRIGFAQPEVNVHTSGANANKPFYSAPNATGFTLKGIAVNHSVSQYGGYLNTSSYDDPLLCICPVEYDMSKLSWRVGAFIWLVDLSTGASFPFDTYRPGYEQGNYLGDVSSKQENTYPNGRYNEYWYTYLGSDCIDPAAVSCVRDGQSVTAAVPPGTNTYGGTVYYQYSYSTNGGSTWVSFGSKTTDTSVTIPIPAGAAQIKVRVQASDDMGFTSSDYVVSDSLSLNGAPTTPGSVTIPDIVRPGRSFTVTWTASTDPDGNLSGYEVERAYNGGSSWTAVTTTAAVSVTDTVAEGYTSVQYRVRAKDSAGLASDWACSNTAVIQADQAPTAPGFVAIPDTVYPGRSFTIRWSASSDPDDDLSGYEVQRAYDGGSAWASVTTTSAISTTDTAARGHTSVRCRVRAKDSKGLTSPWTYSNTAKIQNIGAYIGVGDRARKAAKLYVSVDGQARRVLRGYVGVEGKARLFLDVPIDTAGKDVVGTAVVSASKAWKGVS